MTRPDTVAAEPTRRTQIVAAGLLALALAVLVLAWVGLHLEPLWLAVLALTVHAVWLHRDRFTVHGNSDEARADASQAVDRIEAVENHLSGLEPPSSGKHAPPPHDRSPVTAARTVFPEEHQQMTSPFPLPAARGQAAAHGPVDTGNLWKWVDRLTRDRKHRLVRQAHGSKPTVEYVPVPSLLTQLQEALASTNGGGGSGKSNTGSRSPLDLGKLALIQDMRTTVVRALVFYGQTPATTISPVGVTYIDVKAALRGLAAVAVTLCDPAGVDWWTDRYRRWVTQAELELTAEAESTNLRGVRGHACPVCLALWVTTLRNNEEYREPALVIAFRDGQVQHITCRACETGWWRGDDVQLLTEQITSNTTIYGDAALWGETVKRAGA